MTWFKRIVLILAVLFVVIQVIRPDMSVPAVDPAKTLHASGEATPEVEAIFDRSCNDCHSYKTEWPWYAQMAPVSWMLASHVKDGRKQVNFSEWTTMPAKRKARKLKEICDQVHEGDMPLKTYLPLHPTAKLSDADRAVICAWTSRRIAALGPMPPSQRPPGATATR